jgi:hypothetical protein
MRIFLFILGVFAAVERGWWFVWTQSAVPRRVGARSV